MQVALCDGMASVELRVSHLSSLLDRLTVRGLISKSTAEAEIHEFVVVFGGQGP